MNEKELYGRKIEIAQFRNALTSTIQHFTTTVKASCKHMIYITLNVLVAKAVSRLL